jgi:methyltransferase
MVSYALLLALVAGERMVELAVSARNARRAQARGAVESGRQHFPFMAVMHGAFLASCALEVVLLQRPFPGAVGWAALAVVVLAQALRWWAVLSLGPSWNVRVLVVPGAAPVRTGPYRYVRHPNYVAVVLEIAALPLVHGAWLTALVFSILDAAVLRARIRDEERALGPRWEAAFAGVPRFVPARGAHRS